MGEFVERLPWEQHFVNRDFVHARKLSERILEVERTVDKNFEIIGEMKTLHREILEHNEKGKFQIIRQRSINGKN
jgi:hypothetical protein